MKPVPVNWNDTIYPSMAAAARACGITREAMRLRILAGRNCDDPLLDNGGLPRRPCVWNGVQYGSQTEAARALGITPADMRWRVEQGYICDDDMEWHK